jgi:imidazolonepropionase-like amidohydrolase
MTQKHKMRAFSSLVALLTACATLSGQTVALTGSTVIDGNGGTPIPDGVIVITGKKITSIGPRSSVSIPAGAQRINLSGKYVLPGYMDANVHLFPWPSWTYIEFLARYENNMEGIAEEAAQIALKHGFTTVFDSMGPARPLMRLRDRIAKGEIDGSRLYVAGDIVGFRAVFTTLEAMKSASKAFQERINNLFEAGGGPDLGWLTPEQVKERMRAYVAQGVDFVKYGATGDGAPVNSEVGQDAVLRFSPAQQRAMVEAVHEAGKIIQTHQTSAEALRIVVESGVDMAQHCALTGPSRIPDSTIQLILDKKFYCGTQWAQGPGAEDDKLARPQPYWGSDKANGKDNVSYDVENELRLVKAGVPELVSTDAGVIDPDVEKDGGYGTGPTSLIGEAEFHCMGVMRKRGMTPMMVIQATTKNIAAAYHKLDEFGTLESGKLADLVVVDADPLQDTENMRKISLVMKEGKVIDTGKLPLHPILTSPEAMNPGPVRMK